MGVGTILLAMDRATVRRFDANGFLHVDVSNISKANVCPYYGREIPDWEALGLDPERAYQLYRDPDEIARGAASFNNLPILSRHIPISATEFPKDIVVGSTGTDAVMTGPYLTNSLVIYDQASIDAIVLNRKRELSSAYRYRADMTAGTTPDGLPFEGVMRDIIGNHVALVIEGRAGPDVLVGDEMMKLKSRTALMVSGALAATIRPLLAKDAKVDLSTALKGVTAKSIAMDGAPKRLADAVAALVKQHLAADATLDADALAATIATVQPAKVAEDAIPDEPKADDEEMTDEEKAALDEDDDDKAEDGDDEEEGDKPAMDAATVKKMIAAAEKRGLAAAAAIDQAKRDVQPFVGEVVGMDSADAIYRLALDQAKVDLTHVPEAAYKAMVAMLPKPGASNRVALDAAPPTSKLAAIIPNLPPLNRS